MSHPRSIGWDSIPQIRDVIRQNLDPLSLDQMAIGQLCWGGQLAEEFRTITCADERNRWHRCSSDQAARPGPSSVCAISSAFRRFGRR
jgi:hypothetical protein